MITVHQGLPGGPIVHHADAMEDAINWAEKESIARNQSMYIAVDGEVRLGVVKESDLEAI